MKWKIPPKIKIYEALGCIGDKRIDILGSTAKVFSSSKQKFYSVIYDEKTNSIMSDDNGSYWQGYLGYPSIAFLILKGKITFNEKFAEALKGVRWKDLNTKFKSDYKKTGEFVLEKVKEKGIKPEEFQKEIGNILQQIKNLNINLLGKKVRPPVGY
jgi:hypothetical protein